MRIVYLVSEKTWGGRAAHALALCRCLKSDGWQTMAVTKAGSGADTPFRENGIETSRLPFGGILDVITPTSLARLLRHLPEREIVIHTFSPRDTSLAISARRLAGDTGKVIRVVCTFSGFPDNRPPRRWNLDNTPDRFICTGSQSRKALADSGCPIGDKHIYTLPPCVADTGANIVSRPDNGEDPSATPRMIFTGRIRPDRGLDTLLNALGSIKDLPWHLTVCGVGSGKDVSPLLRTARRLGIDSRIEWAGHVDNVGQRLADADMAVFPLLKSDSLSMGAAEAVAAGLPMVMTSGGDRAEWISEGVSGLTVPPGDPVLLAKALRRMLESPATLRQMRCAPRDSSRFYTTLKNIYTDRD